MLIFFKYANAFLSTINSRLSIVGFGSDLVKIVAPVGISYYIFKEISYLADVYRQKYEPEHSFVRYAAYVGFFPEILSGPISRYNDFQAHLDSAAKCDSIQLQRGFSLILKGLFLKLVIANRLSGYVGTIFSSPGAYGGIALWMATFFYAIQLYSDFAGYSHIAIGITQLLGLRYQENFVRPYFSSNIKEFWKRWHISLSSWLRDYVYIPLGGSRVSRFRGKLNVLVTFLVSGLWHGAGLNFVLWGLWHGLLNVLTPKKLSLRGLRRICAVCINFELVTFGWIFFGTSSLQDALQFLKGMFNRVSLSSAEIQNAILPFTGDNTCVAFFLVACTFCAILFFRELYEELKHAEAKAIPGAGWQAFLLASVLLFGSFGASGFIYANF